MLSDIHRPKTKLLATARARPLGESGHRALPALGVLGVLFRDLPSHLHRRQFRWQSVIAGQWRGWPLWQMGRPNAPRPPLVQFELTPTEFARHHGYSDRAGRGYYSGCDRGVFAFKPSNGLLRGPSEHWRRPSLLPGYWWRIGRRVGIGALEPPAIRTKFMSEIMSALD